MTVLSALSETPSLVLNNYVRQLITCNSSVIISNGMFWTLLAPHACKKCTYSIIYILIYRSSDYYFGKIIIILFCYSSQIQEILEQFIISNRVSTICCKCLYVGWILVWSPGDKSDRLKNSVTDFPFNAQGTQQSLIIWDWVTVYPKSLYFKLIMTALTVLSTKDEVGFAPNIPISH